MGKNCKKKIPYLINYDQFIEDHENDYLLHIEKFRGEKKNNQQIYNSFLEEDEQEKGVEDIDNTNLNLTVNEETPNEAETPNEEASPNEEESPNEETTDDTNNNKTSHLKVLTPNGVTTDL